MASYMVIEWHLYICTLVKYLFINFLHVKASDTRAIPSCVNKIVWMPIFHGIWMDTSARDHWINKIVLKDKQHHDTATTWMSLILLLYFCLTVVLNASALCIGSYVVICAMWNVQSEEKISFFNDSVMISFILCSFKL